MTVQLPFEQAHPLDVSPLLRRLQEDGVIHRVRTEVGDQAWLVTGYEEVRRLLADDRLGRSHPDPAKAARRGQSVLFGGPTGNYDTEQADNAWMRSLLQPHFSPRRMRALRPRVQELTVGLLDDLAAQGSPADLHRALALPLPIQVICELLGVPYADRDRFRAWSEAAGDSRDRARSELGLGELFAYGQQLGKNIPLGILPCGTGNSLAASPGIPLALPHALDVALYGDRQPLDLGWANGKCFGLIAGLGVDAAILACTNAQLKARIGRAAYLTGSRALLSLQRDTFEIQVDDGAPVLLKGYGVMVGNLSRFRAVQRKWPGASFHDGRFEVAVMRSHPALGSVWPADGRFVEWLTGRHVSIRSCHSHLLERDGDVDGSDDFLNVNVIPHGLTVCAPRMASAREWRTVCGLFSAPR